MMGPRGVLRALILAGLLAAAVDGPRAGAFAAPADGAAARLDEAARGRMAAAAQDPAIPAWQREIMGGLAGVAPAPVDSSALPPPPLAAAGAQVVLPAARHLHSSTYDPVRQRLIVFGGTPNQTSFFNDVWALSLVGAPVWTQLTVAGNPPTARSSHSAIYDPPRDRILVFGGYTGPRVNDLWELTLGDDPTWTQLTPNGTPPSARNLHTAVYDGVRDRMLVFGGYSSTYHNDLWQLSLSGTPTWTPLTPAGPLPPTRRQHTAIIDPIRDRMIITGGLGSTGQLGDVWALPLAGAPAWTQLLPGGTSPLPNDSHSAIYDPTGDRMVVFGGIAPMLFRNDAWALSLAGLPVWSFLSVSGAQPAGRILHGAILDVPRQRMVVFGGHRGVSELNDTWTLALAGPPSWTAISPVESQPTAPAPSFLLAQGIPASLYLGQSFTVTLSVRNDGLASDDGRIVVGLPAFTGPGDVARVSAPAGDDAPGFRAFPAGTAIEDRDCAPATASHLIAEYADGDWAALGAETNTLALTVEPAALGEFTVEIRATLRTAGATGCAWVNGVPTGGVGATDALGWSVRRFTVLVNPAPPPGPAPGGRSLHSAIHDPPRGRMVVFGGDAAPLSNETWALTLGEPPLWSLVVPAGTPPAARRGHSAVYDALRERLLVFGGTDGVTRYGDVWALSLAGAPAWQQLTPAGAGPSPRAEHVAVFDATRDRMVVFGGSTGLALLNDVWTLDLSGTPTWTQVVPAGGAPASRSGHRAVLDPLRDRLLVYGGSSSAGSEGDLWALSLDPAPAWTLLLPRVPGVGPEPRTGQTMTLDAAHDRLWFTGGLLGSVRTNDVWSLSLGGLGWREHATWGTAMSARHSHSAILEPAADRLVLFGGWDAVGFSNATWLLSLAEPPTWQPLGSPPPPPPPTLPLPTFAAPVAPSLASIVLGQSFTVTLVARNDGSGSDDGRLVVSFPALTQAEDAGRVSGVASGDSPGYLEHPAGGTLEDASCQPAAVPYLVAEYRDDDWRAFGTETNSITLTVQPRETGTFVFDVRSTMRRRDGAPCEIVNGLPAGGQEGLTDAQGWPVRRFSITVVPMPTAVQPVFTAPVAPVPATISLGQSFTLSLSVRNDGAAGNDGRIVVGLPNFTLVTDVQHVSSTSSGDAPGYREFPAGTALINTTCQSVTASYLVVEYADSDWAPLGAETNALAVTVTPQATGSFVVEVRSTIRTAGGGSCAYVNAVPAEGQAGPPDQQGWEVRRFTVNVLASPPDPSFSGAVATSPVSNVTLGGSISITANVVNLGAASDDGRISISFPALTGPGDAAYASSTSSGDSPGYREYPAGHGILRSDCTPMTAGYLTVEYADAAWQGGGGETNGFVVTVVPQAIGTFPILIRSTMRITGAGPCDYVNDVPAQGVPGTDQQGWAVHVITITVDPVPGPVPAFTAPVAGIPATLPLGESFRVSATVVNNGAATDDGRITVGFRGLVGPSDGSWVASASAGDAPGFQVRLPGSVIANTICQPIGAGYLAAEYVDAAWATGEVNTFSLVVQPPAAGPFVVEVRSTMRNAAPSSGPCLYVNAQPANGTGGSLDQQGWAVRRFTVNVVAPPEPLPPPTATWSLIGPPSGGPSPRGGASAVYHPGRQALLLYGGADPIYQSDVWSLPLATGAGWGPITPGGPVPLRRTLHSMILNPIEDQLVIFAGIYDDYLNDMTVLTLSGVPWWFPNPGSGTRPSARGGHTGTYDPLRHRMLVFGGFDGGLRNDVWEYAPPGTGVWRPLSPQGPAPPGRAQHAAVYDPVRDRVLVFGGDGGTFLGDLWALNLAGAPAWQALSPTGTPPSPRREHSLVYDPVADRVILYGGFDGARRGDVWALSLAGTPAWSRIYSTTVSPANRAAQAAIYDPPRRRMVIFGGDLGPGEWSREVWALGFDLVTPVALSLAGVEATPERVRLRWGGGEVAGLRALVERVEGSGGEWTELGVPWVEGGDQLVYEDRAVRAGARYGYRLTVWEGSEASPQEPVWVTVPERAEVGLAGAWPNPAAGALTVAFSLAGEGEARLEVYDLRGRRVAAREVGALGAGAHRVRLAEAGALPAGVYVVRLSLPGRTLTAKACVVR